jgi:hypothetical protein
MNDVWSYHWDMILARWYGPFSLRFVIQPLAAAILGLRAGLADTRDERSPYGWTIMVCRLSRRALIRQGWRDIGKIFLAALSIDVVYVALEYRWFHPGQNVLIASTVALPAYLATRSLTNRSVRLVRRLSAAFNTDQLP